MLAVIMILQAEDASGSVCLTGSLICMTGIVVGTGVHHLVKAPAESGSSSEDTSDETYAIRHTKKEEEERAKYLTWAGMAFALGNACQS